MFLLYMNPILIAAAVVPAVFLLIRVYRADRLEPEPSGLLLSLILRGVFATVIAPGVSAPQSLGLDPEVVLPLLKHVLRTRKVRGFDICEISPRFDQDNTTANLGAVIIFAVINTLCRMNGLEYAAE